MCAAQTSHFTPTQAGEIFDDVKPRLSVIHHATVNEASREPLLAAVRSVYPSGALVINEDLAVYDISKVHQLLPTSDLQCHGRPSTRKPCRKLSALHWHWQQRIFLDAAASPVCSWSLAALGESALQQLIQFRETLPFYGRNCAEAVACSVSVKHCPCNCMHRRILLVARRLAAHFHLCMILFRGMPAVQRFLFTG